jgi:hypothetical protein
MPLYKEALTRLGMDPATVTAFGMRARRARHLQYRARISQFSAVRFADTAGKGPNGRRRNMWLRERERRRRNGTWHRKRKDRKNSRKGKLEQERN